MAPLSIAPSFLSSFSTRKKKATGGRSFTGKCLGSIAGWDNNRLCFIRQGCGLSSYMSNRGGKGSEKKESGDGNLTHPFPHPPSPGEGRPSPAKSKFWKDSSKKRFELKHAFLKTGKGSAWLPLKIHVKQKTSAPSHQVYFFMSTMKVHFADK